MFRPQMGHHQANTERITGILYWPDDGPFVAETCSPSQELIL